MEKIEIRYHKKVPYIIIGLMVSFIIVLNVLFISGVIKLGKFDIISQGIGTIICLSFLFQFYRKLQSNEPLLEFSEDEIVVNENKKATTIKYSEIKTWKIEQDNDGGTPYLVINTEGFSIRKNIAFLEKSNEEIGMIFKEALSKRSKNQIQ